MMTNKKDYELVMPKNYIDLSKDEMEYDGGFLNFLVAGVTLVVGAAANVAATAGVIDKNTALAINVVCSAVGVVASLGITAAAGAAVNVAVKGAANACIETFNVTYGAAAVVGNATGKPAPSIPSIPTLP